MPPMQDAHDRAKFDRKRKQFRPGAAPNLERRIDRILKQFPAEASKRIYEPTKTGRAGTPRTKMQFDPDTKLDRSQVEDLRKRKKNLRDVWDSTSFASKKR